MSSYINRLNKRLWLRPEAENNKMGQNKGTALQDPFLNALRKERIPVSIYLVNGIKLQGQIESFDQFVIVLRNAVNQMIYKHAVSTVVPSKAVHIDTEDDED